MPLTTNVFNNALQSSGFSPEERLVREAIQNSVDAHRPDAERPVSVRFERRLLSHGDKSRLTSALCLDREPRKRLSLFDLPEGNALAAIQDADDPLPVMIISDYQTHGLPGRWDDYSEGDHFGRLVVNLGVDDKAEGTEISGGSYGFGKTVYGKASRIGIVAFYSAFQPSDRTEGAHARFMATGLFKVHEYKGTKYTGFAFFGAPSPKERGVAIPAIDEDAHQLAEACGIARRSPDEHGTTILILDCDLDINLLKSAAEKYWWPRLIRNELDVVLRDNSTELFPRPKKNADIIPFITAHQNLVSGIEDPPKSQLKQFNRVNTKDGMKKLGTLSSLVLETESSLKNRVALIRQPGMVVDYLLTGSDSYQDCVGVFVSDPDIEKILTYSEPQMHNEWDPNADRLKRKFGEDGVRVVKAVADRVERAFRDFQRSQEPPIPPGGLTPKELSKILGRIFDVRGPDPNPPPEPHKRPISIHVHENRRQKGEDLVVDEAEIQIEVRDDHDVDELACRINAHHEVLGDVSHRVLTRSTCELVQDGKVIAHGAPATADITLRKGVIARLTARAASDPVCLARIRVTVEESL